MMNLDALNTQMDKIDETQLVSIIQTLRSSRGLLGPAIRMFAARYGAEEWADVILSDDTTEEQLTQLFRLVKQERDNGVEAIRAAILSDPITGPLVAKANFRD